LPQRCEHAVDQDCSGFQIPVNGNPLMNLGKLGKFRRIEIYISQAGATAKVTVELFVDAFGDLFQRPAGASTTRAGVQIS